MLWALVFPISSNCQPNSFESGVAMDDSCHVERAYAISVDTASFSRIFKSTGEGAMIEFYPNGNARMAFTSIPGTSDRIELWWFDNGTLMSERVIRANHSKGYVKYWFESGQIKFWAELERSNANGRVLEWDENGTLIRDEVHREGKLRRARIKGYSL